MECINKSLDIWKNAEIGARLRLWKTFLRFFADNLFLLLGEFPRSYVNSILYFPPEILKNLVPAPANTNSNETE